MSEAIPCPSCQRGDPCAENERLLSAKVESLRALLRRVLFEQGGSLPLALRDEIEKEVKP